MNFLPEIPQRYQKISLNKNYQATAAPPEISNPAEENSEDIKPTRHHHKPIQTSSDSYHRHSHKHHKYSHHHSHSRKRHSYSSDSYDYQNSHSRRNTKSKKPKIQKKRIDEYSEEDKRIPIKKEEEFEDNEPKPENISTPKYIIYVAGLTESSKLGSIIKAFESYGIIVAVQLKNGIALIQYATLDAAFHAVNSSHAKITSILGNDFIKIGYASDIDLEDIEALQLEEDKKKQGNLRLQQAKFEEREKKREIEEQSKIEKIELCNTLLDQYEKKQEELKQCTEIERMKTIKTDINQIVTLINNIKKELKID